MRAYNNRNNTSTRRCGYCGESDHVVRTCKHAEREWKEWEAHRVPIHSGHSSANYPYQWYLWHCNDYTKWYKNAKRGYEKIVAHREREALKAAGKSTRATGAVRKCGFCEQAGHTRRNCAAMAKVKREAFQANQNWRRAFYEELVEKRGICEGAAVKVIHRKDWKNDNVEAVGLITSINWDEINFLSSSDRVNWDYRSPLSITVLVGGETKELRLPEPITRNGKVLVGGERHHYYGTATLSEIIGRSDKELDESWVTDGLADEFAWLTKKRNEARLHEYRILKAIETWK